MFPETNDLFTESEQMKKVFEFANQTIQILEENVFEGGIPIRILDYAEGVASQASKDALKFELSPKLENSKLVNRAIIRLESVRFSKNHWLVGYWVDYPVIHLDQGCEKSSEMSKEYQ